MGISATDSVASAFLNKSANTKSPRSPTKAKSAEAQQQIEELKKRDQEVRAHEQAHLAALGVYSKGGASYTFERGPDGQKYATGGEVSVDVSPAKTPEETLRKAAIIKRAALAPAQPSAQDRAVATQAAQMEQQAQQALRAEKGKANSNSNTNTQLHVIA